MWVKLKLLTPFQKYFRVDAFSNVLVGFSSNCRELKNMYACTLKQGEFYTANILYSSLHKCAIFTSSGTKLFLPSLRGKQKRISLTRHHF